MPDRFLVVVLSAVFTWYFRWDQKGLEILGEVKPISGGNPFPFNWPFQFRHMKHIREAMGTSFLIALLGFFESSVAAKALGGGEGKGRDGIQGIQLSPNRELVALGVANLVGGCFNSLPAFGGYGRSKVNASTGGKTPMSNILLSIITIICIIFLLPYFYFLPVSLSKREPRFIFTGQIIVIKSVFANNDAEGCTFVHDHGSSMVPYRRSTP
jgi:MFS superfamily sulfate permease-like transporter